jgi:hypothetical protein
MKSGVCRVWIGPSSRLYVVGKSVLIGEAGNWHGLTANDPEMTVTGIGGNAENDLYISGRWYGGSSTSEVFHYNGKDWFRFKETQLKDYQPMDLWTDGHDVFVVGYTYWGKTIVMHGN